MLPKETVLAKKQPHFGEHRFLLLFRYLDVFGIGVKERVQPGALACTCDPPELKTKFWNSVGLIPVDCNIPSIDVWIVWSSLHKSEVFH